MANTGTPNEAAKDIASLASDARFARYCWAVAAFTVLVILWGAVVRATGSGAGCGSSWPTCNGEVVPLAPTLKTLIEFGHRLTSGLAALAVLGQWIWARRRFQPGHRVRRSVGYAAVFMLFEVAIGAGIVLLHYVDQNKSVGRALWMSVHLVNTFLLVGALAIAARYAAGGAAFRFRNGGRLGALALVGLGALLLSGMSGAVAALGDTVFPPESLGSALAQDLSPTAHILIRLRMIHPFVAVFTAFGLLAIRAAFSHHYADNPELPRLGMAVRALVVAQVVAGFVNMLLLAPIALQIVHLLLANLLWIVLLLFFSSALCNDEEVQAASPETLNERTAAAKP